MFGAFVLVFIAAVGGIIYPYLGLKRSHFAWSAAAAFVMMMITVPPQPKSTGQSAEASTPHKDLVQMEKDNAVEIASLKTEVAKVPASDIDENLRIYRRLNELAPANADFIEKKDGYEAKARGRERWRENPEEALEIADWNWSKGGFDSIMIIDRMTITNSAPFAIKDFTVKCTHQGPSGTDMDSNTRQVFDVVPANGKKTVREINMGFIHSQAVSSNCVITNADLA